MLYIILWRERTKVLTTNLHEPVIRTKVEGHARVASKLQFVVSTLVPYGDAAQDGKLLIVDGIPTRGLGKNFSPF